MVSIFGISLFGIVFLAVWKKLHLRNEQLKFKYKLYQLRDELRADAIAGKIDGDEWLFDYYDRTLSKLISNSYYITLASLTWIEARHKGDVKLSNFINELSHKRSKSEYFKTLDNQIKANGYNYLVEQLRISLNYIVMPILLPVFRVAGWVKGAKQAIANLTVFPEISDSQRFAGG